jgi:hypothetical protein
LLEGFEELNAELIRGGDLASGQDGYVAHWDLSFLSLGEVLGPLGVASPGGPLMCLIDLENCSRVRAVSEGDWKRRWVMSDPR